MKQLNIIILSLGVILFTSCKKEEEKPNIIKYEVTSTYLGEMEISRCYLIFYYIRFFFFFFT